MMLKLLVGCRKIIGLGIFACIVIFVLSLIGGNPSTDSLPTLAVLPSLTWTPEAVAIIATDTPGVTIIPTVVRASSGFVTITPAPGTIYPTPTITDTPLPTATNTELPTATAMPISSPTPSIQLINATTYYVVHVANVRSCASSTCNKLGQVTVGTNMTVSGLADGEEVMPGNPKWYQVQYGGTLAFVYSAYLTDVAPVQVQAQVQQPVAPIVAPVSPITSVTCPDITATCQQLTCEQAYACLKAGNSRLDGDGNGVPCQNVCGS